MLRRRKSKDELWEQIVAEKQREIDWLRAQLGMPSLLPVAQPADPGPLPIIPRRPGSEPLIIGSQGWISEEEEEAQALLEAGELSPEHLPEILDALGFASSDIT